MDDNNKLKDVGNGLREIADIIDEIIMIDDKQDKGEEDIKKLEAATGRLMFKMLELQVLSGR